MKKFLAIVLTSAFLSLPMAAFGKGIIGTYMSDTGIIIFYCGGRVEGIDGYHSYRQLGDNRVMLYKSNGRAEVFDFIISADRSKIWLSGF